MERLKVDVQDLKLGMYVAELDRPWLETSFLFQGFTIQRADEISALRHYCKHVYIDVEQSSAAVREAMRGGALLFQANSDGMKRPHVIVSNTDRTAAHASFESEIGAALQIYHKSREYIDSVFEDVRLGRSINTDGARELANQVVDSIVRNESAMVWFSQLKNRDEYTAQHSVNVCVLAVLFGRHLGLANDVLRELGFGALLHDIGKMQIPLEILNKESRLSDEEMALMRQHPQFGYQILQKSGGVTELIREIALAHHERIDGSGYPRQLEGDAIHPHVMIVSIVDVYDAVTSDRSYHMGISPHEALNMMYGLASDSLDKELLEAFIRCLGIYPIGSIVELDTGEVGVVMTVNRQHVMRPLLTLVLDRDKRPLPRLKLLNLDAVGRAGNEIGIRKILGANSYGIDVPQIIMESQVKSAVH